MKKYLMHMFAAAAFLAALHPLRASAAADEVQVDETGAVSIVWFWTQPVRMQVL